MNKKVSILINVMTIFLFQTFGFKFFSLRYFIWIHTASVIKHIAFLIFVLCEFIPASSLKVKKFSWRIEQPRRDDLGGKKKPNDEKRSFDIKHMGFKNTSPVVVHLIMIPSLDYLAIQLFVFPHEWMFIEYCLFLHMVKFCYTKLVI